MKKKKEKKMINEEIVDDYNEEIETVKEEEESFGEDELKEFEEDSKLTKFIKRFLYATIDQIIILVLALVLLLVFDSILRIVGFYVAERQPIFLVVYIVTNVLYNSIYESPNPKKTIGKKIALK